MAEAFLLATLHAWQALTGKGSADAGCSRFAPASGIPLAELNTLKANAGLYREKRIRPFAALED
jgi:hypothetical protein